MIVGSFGSNFIFGVQQAKVLTPKSVQRELSATYEKHVVLGSKERLEFLRPNISSFKMDIILSWSLGVNPSEIMKIIKDIVEYGKVEQLILGGENYGHFIINKASASWNKTGPKGQPLSMDVKLDFEEYIDE